MRFIIFQKQGQRQVGLWLKEKKSIVALNTINGLEEIKTMYDVIYFNQNTLISCIDNTLKSIDDYNLMEETDVKFCSPFPTIMRNVICLGFNYIEHVGEVGSNLGRKIEVPKAPIYFSKMAAETIGPGGVINGSYTKELDYEVELAVIIGKEGTNIPVTEAEDFIFGYTIMNDISARDFQRNHKQYLKGKSLDTFTSLGPCVLHKRELPFPLELGISSKVNGELRQNSNTSNLLFNIPTIISDLSQGITLKPGDIIATGTPSGVGMGFTPPRYLKAGDTVSCIVEKIGILENVVE